MDVLLYRPWASCGFDDFRGKCGLCPGTAGAPSPGKPLVGRKWLSWVKWNDYGKYGNHRSATGRARSRHPPASDPSRGRVARRGQHRSLHYPLSQGPDGRAGRGADSRDSSRLDENAAAGRTQADHPPLDRVAGQTHREAGQANSQRPRPPTAGRPVSAVQAQEADAGHPGPVAGAGAPGPRNSGSRAACAIWTRGPADFVNTDRQIPTAADALLGAGHILAEQFSEQAELRQRLREVLQRRPACW